MNKIEELKAEGIPVSQAIFHSAIESGFKTAEHRLLAKSDNKQRQATMYFTALGLLVIQNGKHILVPLANVIDVQLVQE